MKRNNGVLLPLLIPVVLVDGSDSTLNRTGRKIYGNRYTLLTKIDKERPHRNAIKLFGFVYRFSTETFEIFCIYKTMNKNK